MDLAAKQIFSFLQNFGSDNKIVILVTVDNGLYFDVSLKQRFQCMFIEHTHRGNPALSRNDFSANLFECDFIVNYVSI